MAKLTVQNYRDRSREIVDLESSELTDALVDLWLKEAAQAAQNWNQGAWPFYKKIWTVTWPASTASQTLTQLDALHGETETIREIIGMRSDDRRKFAYMSRDDLYQWVARDNTSEGTPWLWSPWNDDIRIFPTPSGATDIDILGWQAHDDWVADGAGGESDMPEDFDYAILSFLLSRIYSWQDEPQTSVFWLQNAQLKLEQLEDKYDSMPPVDMVLNGSAIPRWTPETPGRIPFDFEF